MRNSQPDVAVVRTLTELGELRSEWSRLPGGVVTTDVDAFMTLLEASDHTGTAPYVIALRDDGRLRTLVAGRVDQLELPVKVGYKSVYSPRLRAITIPYGAVFGDLSADSVRLVMAQLLHALQRREADVVRLRALRLDTTLHDVAASMLPALRRHLGEPTGHWVAELPPVFDTFLARLSSRTREGVKRYGRKLERDFAGRLELRSHSSPEHLEGFFADANAVAAKTFQHSLGAALIDAGALRRLIESSATDGRFRGWSLTIDGVPVAFWHGILWRGVFSIGVPGYDPAYANQRVGTYLLLKAIDALCAEGVHTLDFGFGDAEYKRRFGTKRWLERDIHLFAPTLKGVRTHAIRSGVLFAAGHGRRLLERRNAAGRVKRRWRGRLTPGARGR